MSGLPWFRAYSEKILIDFSSLSNNEFRTYFELYAHAGRYDRTGNTGIKKEEIAKILHRKSAQLAAEKLINSNYLSINSDGNVVVNNFVDENFVSDNSTERTRKHRENKEIPSHVQVNIDQDFSENHQSRERSRDALDTDTDIDKKNITTNVVIQKEKLKPKKKLKRKTQYPPDFQITPMHLALAHKHDWPSPHDELEPFRNYHESHGNLFLNWDKAFYTWLRNAKKFNGRSNGNPQGNVNRPPSSREQNIIHAIQWTKDQMQRNWEDNPIYDA